MIQITKEKDKPTTATAPMKDEDDSLWQKGVLIQSISTEEMEKKDRTINMRNDEEMDFNCRKCEVKISAHNKEWHDGMCDDCCDRTYFQE